MTKICKKSGVLRCKGTHTLPIPCSTAFFAVSLHLATLVRVLRVGAVFLFFSFPYWKMHIFACLFSFLVFGACWIVKISKKVRSKSLYSRCRSCRCRREQTALMFEFAPGRKSKVQSKLQSN